VNFSFAEYWIWMLGLPVSVGIMFLVYKRVSQLTTRWFSPDQYSRSYPEWKLGLRVGSFLLLFVGLMGPYWGVSEQQVSSLGREIYLLLDVSASMNATDVKPSRLARAKQEIERILPMLEGDRVGLMVFTENPYVQCPLTQDHAALRLFLQMGSTEQFKQTGTQFRPVMTRVVERMSETRQLQPDISQAVVLISDGEDHGDRYASLIGRLRQGGIRVFPVGIGTASGAQVPQVEEGRRLGYYRYEDGSPVISQLNDAPLRELAESFGTPYYQISGPDDHLGELGRQISQLETSRLETRIKEVENNKYQAFLLIAVLLLFISLFLMPIRKE